MGASRGVRPTGGRVRTALFSLLDSLNFHPSTVLDLFAGIGSLGIEALSRGADLADFVEKDRRSCKAIRNNLLLTALNNPGKIIPWTAERAIKQLEGSYDLVLVDPPYQYTGIAPLLQNLLSSARVHTGSLVVLEHTVLQPSPVIATATRIKQRRYGDTAVTVYEYCEEKNRE